MFVFFEIKKYKNKGNPTKALIVALERRMFDNISKTIKKLFDDQTKMQQFIQSERILIKTASNYSSESNFQSKKNKIVIIQPPSGDNLTDR